MILLVDTNPILERSLHGDRFPSGGTGYAASNETMAAGSGAEMLRLADNMNEEARLVTFLGGLAGERYEKLLERSGLSLSVQPIRDETQERFLLQEKYKTTRILTRQPRLTREDMADFYERFVTEMIRSDVVVIAKSTRAESPDAMKLAMARYARKKARPVIILAEEADEVEAIREARPFGMIVDRQILVEKSGRNLRYLGDIIAALENLYADTIPFILVTGSHRGTLLYCRDALYVALNDEVKNRLDRHYAAVGLAAGIVRKYDPMTLLKLATAAGRHRPETDFATIKSDMNGIEITKMEV